MKSVQLSNHESTPVNVDKEAMRWSLSWHPDGRCDSFTREAILACVPPASGVYGLFNFDCQIFIEESANIQEALLRHESASNFQTRHLQPTGFTFEPCAAELRGIMANELVARFHPVLQDEAALNQTWSPLDSSTLSETDVDKQDLETYAHDQEFPVHERENRPNLYRRFYFTRTRGAALATIVVASAAVTFYLGIPVDKYIQKLVNGTVENRLDAKFNRAIAVADGAAIGLKPRKVSSMETGGGIAQQSAALTPAMPDAHVFAPIASSAESASLSRKWSVQIAAAPAKDIADTLVAWVIAKGYDSYVVQAEVNGKTYYRVRVGHFDKRDEAESVRQSLMQEASYRDAYLTGD